MGKAVEINALWFNALKLMQSSGRVIPNDNPSFYGQQAERVSRSFNDLIRTPAANISTIWSIRSDGKPKNDPKCRPNQVIAISLPHPVLVHERWAPVMRIVRDRLVTPVGLRSLSPDDPDFKPRYFGDLRARDAAYHQGTVWGWLVGPFIDAWLKVYPDDIEGARNALQGFVPHLNDGLRWIDQRGLRCRSAIHSSRLYRSGVERGGGAPRMGARGSTIQAALAAGKWDLSGVDGIALATVSGKEQTMDKR